MFPMATPSPQTELTPDEQEQVNAALRELKEHGFGRVEVYFRNGYVENVDLTRTFKVKRSAH